MRMAVVTLLAACAPHTPTLTDGTLEVTLDADAGLQVWRDGAVILASATDATAGGGDPHREGAPYAAFAAASTEREDVDEHFGFFRFDTEIGPWTALTPGAVALEDDALVFTVEGGSGRVRLEDGAVRITWSSSLGDRLAMSFACVPGERLYGTGARVDVGMQGQRVPIWTSEQGIGKADPGEPPALFGIEGTWHDTYVAVPWALSSRGLGLWLDGSGRSELELCEDGRLRLETPDDAHDLVIFPAGTMAGALEAFTARTGRPRPMNRWTFAPWIDAWGGPDGLVAAATAARDAGIPASAIWGEDWVGVLRFLDGEHLTYDWEEDPERYPDLGATADALHALGLRYLVYVNPFIVPGTDLYEDAQDGGALVTDAAGEVLHVTFPWGNPPALFDPTSALGPSLFAAALDRAVDQGVDGWMADYGEALPVEAVLADGTPGALAHNRYPLLWASTSADYWSARRPDADFATFSRSGHTGIAGAAHVHWLGDQFTNFDRGDGLPSVVRLYLSAGLSGVPLTHSDVGGYTSVGTTVRTPELLARWLTLEAFTPVLRTHHTTKPDTLQWSSDEGTRALFARYFTWHQRLLPYWTTLADEAATRGTPAVRPLWWGDETDEALLDVDDAFLSGPDLLVAPLLEEGATSRPVPLPGGAWRRWRDLGVLDEAREGSVVAEAAVDEAIVYVRAGAVLPLLADDYDTVAPTRPGDVLADGLRAAPDRIGALRLLITAGGTHTGRAVGQGLPSLTWTWDGRALSGPLVAVRLEGADLPACATPDALDCLDGDVARLAGASATRGPLTLMGTEGSGVLEVEAEGLDRLDLQLK